MDGFENEMGHFGLRERNGEVWSFVTCLFTKGTMLLAESVGELQRVVNEFCSICKRRKLKVNTRKSKVLLSGGSWM